MRGIPVNRHEFIKDLKKRLERLPFDEVKEAVDYYERYFDDAGEENEQTVLEGLGSPSEVAAQIIADFAVKENPVKRGLSSAWIVILAVFASPIALPLALVVVVIALTIVIIMLSVLLSVGATGLGLFLGGIMSAVSGLLVITQSVPTALLYLGVGLVFCGVGTAAIVFTGFLSQKCFGWLTKRVGNFIISRRAAK